MGIIKNGVKLKSYTKLTQLSILLFRFFENLNSINLLKTPLGQAQYYKVYLLISMYLKCFAETLIDEFYTQRNMRLIVESLKRFVHTLLIVRYKTLDDRLQICVALPTLCKGLRSSICLAP